jgi:hypothetical protein
MNNNSIWSALEESFDILGDYGYPATDKVADQLGLEPGWFTWVVAIWLFGSEAFTTLNFMHMFPYGSALVNEERFSSAVRRGYLISDGKNGYLTTEDGSLVGQKMWRAAGDSLTNLPTPPETDLQRLFGYLTRIADAALAAPEPPSHYYISHKRQNYGQYGTKRPLEDFVVCFGVLSSYRDASHITAWQSHHLEGNRWEVLSFVWRGEINTLDKVFEQLSYRGISREDYAQILQELVRCGWMEENAGAYQLTAEGKRVREEAEALTDRYFFAPWSCLNEEELEDLSTLASRLRDGLKAKHGQSE